VRDEMYGPGIRALEQRVEPRIVERRVAAEGAASLEPDAGAVVMKTLANFATR
jgi:hypothetical protein